MQSRRRLLTEALGLALQQAEVDFVIPDLRVDTPLGIDPFLLFKSRDEGYRAAHDQILQLFNEAIRLFRTAQVPDAQYLIDFPEASEISMGYRRVGRSGTGLGAYLNQLLFETLSASPRLVERGLRHIEEMQLVSLGIAADRVSDIAGNILKRFLIDYTQRQCEIWGIPTRSGPVHHVFDFDAWHWEDLYEDLPFNPESNQTILFVPKRIVRVLPWINFDDYMRREFAVYLRAKATRGHALRLTRPPRADSEALSKPQVVEITRREVERIDRYVDHKERTGRDARPDSQLLVSGSEQSRLIDELLSELDSLEPGIERAYDFQDLAFRILSVAFNPELAEGKRQERTEYGTEIRDIVFINESDLPFWDYVRNQHGNFLVVFEAKNTLHIDNRDIDQLSGYVGDPTGYVGFLVSRHALEDPQRLKAFAVYNRSTPRRVLLHLSDEDLRRMLLMKKAGNEPTRLVQGKYRDFMGRVQ